MWKRKYGKAMYEKNEALKKLNESNSNINRQVKNIGSKFFIFFNIYNFLLIIS